MKSNNLSILQWGPGTTCACRFCGANLPNILSECNCRNTLPIVRASTRRIGIQDGRMVLIPIAGEPTEFLDERGNVIPLPYAEPGTPGVLGYGK